MTDADERGHSQQAPYDVPFGARFALVAFEVDLLGAHADADLRRGAVQALHRDPDHGPALHLNGGVLRAASLDASVEEVRRAEEPGHELRLRVLVDVARLADLLDPPVAHHRESVRHRHRFFLVVRDVQERDPDLLLDPLQLELHLLAKLQVERAERFVEQEQARIVDERASERDPLLLTARELSGLASLEPLEVDEAQDLLHAAFGLGPRDLLAPQAEFHVVDHIEMGEQRVGLEDRVDVSAVRREVGDVPPGEVDGADARVLEPPDHPERGRLPAPRRPEQAEELAAPDIEGQVVDRCDLPEPLRHAVEADVDLVQAPALLTH